MTRCNRHMLAGLILVGMMASGCRTKDPDNYEIPAGHQNLRTISAAYHRYYDKYGEPPRNLDDLMPVLRAFGNAAEIIKSPSDNEPFVILWNVDIRKYATGPRPVLAYERTGKNGKRSVLLIREVVDMTDAELKAATFPPGHKAP